MQKILISFLKDIVSLCIYLVICPFRSNKNAVLVYHSVDNIDLCRNPSKINVRPELFEKHMRHIAKNKERFLVSFDDGFESVYSYAFPVIKKYKIRAVLFISTDFIDKTPRAASPLTWEQIREMAAQGFELGSHTISHRYLAGLAEDDIYREAAVSKKRIEDMTGNKIDLFAYPYGNTRAFNEKTAAILKNSGYKRAYINMMGMDNSDKNPFEIKRIRIYGTDNMIRFKMKISGAYNWVDMLTL